MRRKNNIIKTIAAMILLVAATNISFARTARDSQRYADSLKTVVANRVAPIQLSDWRTINYDTIKLNTNYAFVPLIFQHQTLQSDTIVTVKNDGKYGLDVDTEWINSAIGNKNKVNTLRYATMASRPELVLYNAEELPEAPKEFYGVVDPRSRTLTVDGKDFSKRPDVETKSSIIKVHNWLHSFVGSLQFSQAYMSENWYQGGNNNLNALGEVQWNVTLNQNVHPNYLFSNTVRYKVGVNSTPNDTLRSYNLSEDLFQINTQVGIKAIKKWYYSATMQFKTQLLNNYAANTNDRKAAFLSPGELNVGVGVTYNSTSKDGWRNFSLSISPVSYNMKICRTDENPLPTKFGINEGHHTTHDIGSKIEAKFSCKFNPSVSWTSRFYAFSNYEYVLGDWENTFHFSVTRNLITQFYTHVRYDKSVAKNATWNYWQFKEILSFGLTYKFATN